MTPRKSFSASLALVAVLGLATLGSVVSTPSAHAAGPASGLPVLAPAPAWKLKDLAGNEVSSETFKGKVVVVDFWATWCGPCKEEIPGYVELQKKYADKGLVIVGVSLDQQGPPVVKKYAAAAKINYQLVMGNDETVAAFGGFDAIPTTFLIDRDGQIRHKKIGTMETAEYEQLLKQLLD